MNIYETLTGLLYKKCKTLTGLLHFVRVVHVK